MIVLDNAGLHRAAAVRDAAPALRARNVFLHDLPPSALELNAIEPIFRAVMHTGLPERRYASAAEPEAAVDAPYAWVETRVLGKAPNQPRLSRSW